LVLIGRCVEHRTCAGGDIVLNHVAIRDGPRRALAPT
jgi:hypothetical protein